MADGSLVLDRPDQRVRDRFTADEFMIMCEAGVFGDVANIELLDGKIVEMPPEGTGHGAHKAQSFRVLDRIVQGLPHLLIASNVALRLGPRIVVAPDVLVSTFPTGWPSAVAASEMKLALEHAWSTHGYDLGEKPERYAKAGVAELWVVDDRFRVLHRFHAPKDGVYQRDPPRGLEEQLDVPFAPGERVRVRDLFDPR